MDTYIFNFTMNNKTSCTSTILTDDINNIITKIMNNPSTIFWPKSKDGNILVVATKEITSIIIQKV